MIKRSEEEEAVRVLVKMVGDALTQHEFGGIPVLHKVAQTGLVAILKVFVEEMGGGVLATEMGRGRVHTAASRCC